MSGAPEHSHRPLRKWGQNFLRNATAAEKIADAVDPGPGDLVVEIGPGDGALTRRFVARGYRVRAIEIDPSLARRLREEFPDVDVIEDDATTAPLPDEPWVAVGNLPYNVATPIVRRVVASTGCLRAVFMVQNEVANRLMAEPGSPDYGYLTLVTRLYAQPRVLTRLGPGSFRPRPKVQSAVVVFEVHPPQLPVDEGDLLSLLSVAFRMRRKTLLNNLAGYRGANRETATRWIERANLDPGIRAERLALDDFIRLAVVIDSGSE